MTRVLGRGLLGLGTAIALVWMLLPLYRYDDAPSLWQATSRFDILMCLLLLATLAGLLAAAVTSAGELLDGLASMVGGGTATIVMYVGLEGQWSEPLRVVFAAVIAGTLVAGGGLLALPAPVAARVSAAMSQAATQRPRVPVAPQPAATAATPAGWYPDPSGHHATRYWDGGIWTDQVR